MSSEELASHEEGIGIENNEQPAKQEKLPQQITTHATHRDVIYLGIAAAVCFSFVGYLASGQLQMNALQDSTSGSDYDGDFSIVKASWPFVMGVILLLRHIRLLLVNSRVRPVLWLSLPVPIMPLAIFGSDMFPILDLIIMCTVFSALLSPLSMVIGLIGTGFCLNGWEASPEAKA